MLEQQRSDANSGLIVRLLAI